MFICRESFSPKSWPPMSSDPVEERSKAVERYKHLENYRQVAKEFKKSPNWVKKWVRRAKNGLSMHNLPRSGRPQTLSSAEEKKAVELLKDTHEGSLRRVSKRLRRDGGASPARSTLQRMAKKRRMRYVSERRQPLLTNTQKKKRVAFASTSRPRHYWRKVIFTDESPFLVFLPPHKVWCEEKEAPPIRPTVKYSPKLQVWGGISYNGKTPLIRIDQGIRLNAAGYQEIIQESLPALQRLYPVRDRAVMMQDGAPCHRAKSTLKALKEMGIRLLEGWPAQSPDLNPIENLWGTLQDNLYHHDITTVDDLWAALQEEWDKITLQDLRAYIDSMPKRLKLVIENKGGSIKY